MVCNHHLDYKLELGCCNSFESLTVSGVLRLRRTLHLLLVLCWLTIVICWLLFEVLFFLEK
ncbi:hypothetical protein OROGR_034162 [Orobanche gracilis]